MRKAREEKAITLIALIITIVVLLILAVVAINSVTGDGIIQHATNAKTQYEEGQAKENSMLSYYQEYITSQIGWKQSGTKVTKDDMTLNVGDIVNYASNTNTSIKWAVLGAKDGKVLLVSTTNVATETLSGTIDYINDAGIKRLNAIGADYDDGIGAVADSGRSIDVDDINRVTGYNPLKTGNGKIYEEGDVKQYLNKVTYKIQNGVVCYTSNVNENLTESSYIDFVKLNGEELGDGESITIDNSNMYWYWPESLSTEEASGTVNGISNQSSAYTLLFDDTDLNTGNPYWLATSYIGAMDGFVVYGVRGVNGGCVIGQYLWRTIGDPGGNERGVRAVVSLQADVQFTPDENNENTYNISLPNE